MGSCDANLPSARWRELLADACEWLLDAADHEERLREPMPEVRQYLNRERRRAYELAEERLRAARDMAREDPSVVPGVVALLTDAADAARGRSLRLAARALARAFRLSNSSGAGVAPVADALREMLRGNEHMLLSSRLVVGLVGAAATQEAAALRGEESRLPPHANFAVGDAAEALPRDAARAMTGAAALALAVTPRADDVKGELLEAAAILARYATDGGAPLPPDAGRRALAAVRELIAELELTGGDEL